MNNQIINNEEILIMEIVTKRIDALEEAMTQIHFEIDDQMKELHNRLSEVVNRDSIGSLADVFPVYKIKSLLFFDIPEATNAIKNNLLELDAVYKDYEYFRSIEQKIYSE